MDGKSLQKYPIDGGVSYDAIFGLALFLQYITYLYDNNTFNCKDLPRSSD